MKQYNTFPYNENQKMLHLTEDRYIANLEGIIKHFAHTKEDKEKLRKELFEEIEKIKKQDPHPAEVLADFQGCFWDRDLYWMHWDSDKHIIIPRMMVMEFEKSIEVLEKFYKREEILNVLKETRENIPEQTYKFISKRYDIHFPRPVFFAPPFWNENRRK